jgi:hypothetical protein
MALHLQHAAFKNGEKAGWSGADDGDIGGMALSRHEHGNPSVIGQIAGILPRSLWQINQGSRFRSKTVRISGD